MKEITEILKFGIMSLKVSFVLNIFLDKQLSWSKFQIVRKFYLQKQSSIDFVQKTVLKNLTKVSFLLMKLQAEGLQIYLKKRLWSSCLTRNFAKFSSTVFSEGFHD